MSDLDDPIIATLHQHINAIADMCEANIRPWEPDAGVRAVRLVNALEKPYIHALWDYMASRPKSFPGPWCNGLGDLVPDENTDNYLD